MSPGSVLKARSFAESFFCVSSSRGEFAISMEILNLSSVIQSAWVKRFSDFSGLAAAGLHTRGVGFAHGFHTPYWVLRSIMHLPNADQSAIVRAYRLFLIQATGSKLMDRLEKWLNFVCPKSLILYAEKRARRSGRETRRD